MEFGLIRTWLGAPIGEMVHLQTHNGCRQGCTAWSSHCITFNSCMNSKHERNIDEYCWVKFCALIIPNAKESRCIQCSVHFWPAGPFDESSLELVSSAFHINWPAYCISFLKRRRQSLQPQNVEFTWKGELSRRFIRLVPLEMLKCFID